MRLIACAHCGRTEFPHVRRLRVGDDVRLDNFKLSLAEEHHYEPMALNSGSMDSGGSPDLNWQWR